MWSNTRATQATKLWIDVGRWRLSLRRLILRRRRRDERQRADKCCERPKRSSKRGGSRTIGKRVHTPYVAAGGKHTCTTWRTQQGWQPSRLARVHGCWGDRASYHPHHTLFSSCLCVCVCVCVCVFADFKITQRPIGLFTSLISQAKLFVLLLKPHPPPSSLWPLSLHPSSSSSSSSHFPTSNAAGFVFFPPKKKTS